jgi:hypothetical protein
MMAFRKRNEETKTGAEKCPRGRKQLSIEEAAIQREVA